MTNTATIRCYGAVRTVTGSMHLLEANGDRVLLDCGLFQGPRAEARQRNERFPFDPRSITTLVLSHAHMDHAGNIPNLVKQGFQGEIICTSATRDLAEVMLEDSAHIQEMDALYMNRKLAARRPGAGAGQRPGEDTETDRRETTGRGPSRGRFSLRGERPDDVKPLYTVEDARRCVKLMRGIPYRHEVEVAKGVRATFIEAGHILGSASVGLTIDLGGGVTKRVSFTGDVGRVGMPIIRDPEPLAPADLVITESTYGNKLHPPIEDEAAKLRDVVKRTADRGGKVIVPAFAVGRTQNLVYVLHRLFIAKELPELPIYVDSPLSSKATQVYRAHPECYDTETREAFLEEHRDPFGFARLTYITSVDESKALNDRKEPCIIIASSGMCEAGRILHHLKNNIGDARNTVLIAGFQAENTLGRRLVEKRETVRVFGEDYKLRAEVVTANGLSAHADWKGLLDVYPRDARKPRLALIVHGEVPQGEALKAHLRDGGIEGVLPTAGQEFEV